MNAQQSTSELKWRRSWCDLKEIGQIICESAKSWNRDNAMRLSAAASMYAILSIAPVLIITIRFAAVVVNNQAAAGEVRHQVNAFFDPIQAAAINSMIADSYQSSSGAIAAVFSICFLLITASGVFNELRDSLNSIWKIKIKCRRSYWAVFRDRLFSIVMIFAVGILLFASQIISIGITVMSEYLGDVNAAAFVLDLLASTAIIAILFAILFRVLPDARLEWNDVIFGATVTAILFKIGQYLQAIYFTYGAPASIYGAAGSFVVVLLWVYYSFWIFFFGAELIAERARLLGHSIPPREDAARFENAPEPACAEG